MIAMTDREGATVRHGDGRTRRDVLAAAGAAGVAGLAGCLPDGDGGGATPTPGGSTAYANYPVRGDTVRIGVSVPETGVYQGEGQQLTAGYELAAMNINQSQGYVNNEHFAVLEGSEGIRGKTVELVVDDTGSSADQARESARNLIDEEDAIVLAGGASSDEAIAHQQVARDRGVVHMIGFAPGNSIGGRNCAITGFQEMFNAREAAQALRPVLVSEHGEEVDFAQVRPNSDVGETFAVSIRQEMLGAGWNQLAVETTRVGTQNFEGPIAAARDQEPEVLVLNYYGLDGAFALRQAARVTEGEDIDVVVPLYNRPMARNAGGAMEGVLGTIHWESNILERYSRMFTQAWTRAYGGDDRKATHPSGLAHLAYSQLFQYAAAVERAGSFEPPAVVDELEGYAYDLGMGAEEMRGCDHTADRPVPIVRGLAAENQYWGKYYEIEDIITDVGYGCEEAPATRCELGSL